MAARPHLDLDDYLPYLINRVGFALAASLHRGRADAATGSAIAMWRVLAALSNNGEQRQIDLVDMTSIDASTMSRLVTRLVRMGLVTRAPLEDLQPRGRGRAVAQGPGAGRKPDPDRQKSGDRPRARACRPRSWPWSSARCGGCTTTFGLSRA